jgi:ATP-dependent RNA helicase SUPV3L1/SUV3
MAKKKRKHLIKLNNKLKTLLHNIPFDVAIENFSEDLLYGLVLSINESFEALDKKSMVKYLRRVWSEGSYETRKKIVSFLDEYYTTSELEKKDKVETILACLEGEETTYEEQEEILSAFIDKKLSKITPQKVLNKLYYIRMNKELEALSKKLDISFFGNFIEFSALHSFVLDEQEFNLNLLHKAELNPPLKELLNKEKEEIIQILEDIKQKAYEEKEKELQEFLNNVQKVQETKTLADIFKAVKEPIENLYHCPIPDKIIKKSLKKLDKDLEITSNRLNFLIAKTFTHKLFEEELEFDIFLDYEKKLLFNLFWSNKLDSILSDLEEEKEEVINQFENFVQNLQEKLKENAHPLENAEKEATSFIQKFLTPLIKNNRSLKLKDKVARRAIYQFNEAIKPLKEKQKRAELLAKTIRDFKQLFPVARSLNREIIFHVGPTNSGKTYSAMQELQKAESGLYLAPLRLLALEGYEKLKENGVNASLITGEEEIIDEESTHISSTIEMLNSDIEVDVCVIDEIQMIADKDRGWAWANALIGAPAKKVILTGSSDALEVIKELANYLNEPLTVVEHERKNPLQLMQRPTPLEELEEATAIVTFSRKEVLALKNKISKRFNVSVVYGNLSPEVRREEARRFREGESQVLIATDAIAMGLNLPIKTILFAKDNKFDGFKRRELTSSEILQIAGRAGRYGLHESGFVGALDSPTLSTIKEKFNKPLESISLPIRVMASLEHVLLISEILDTQNLYEILEFFASNMEFEGPFRAANIESMLEVAQIVDEYNLDLVSKYHLACAPVSLSSPYLEKVFHRYLKLLEEGKEVDFIEPKNMAKKALSYNALLNAEDRVKEVSLYLWLSFKFADKFKDTEVAKRARDKLNQYIEKTLREADFTKVCRRCGKELDLSYRFMICDNCYNKNTRKRKK